MLCMIVLLYRIISKMERGKGAAGGGPGSYGSKGPEGSKGSGGRK